MLGRNVQAYVDDMVMTSLEKSRHVTDLEELFVTIAKYKLKLNLEKCIFGVEAGKFLGFLLTERGIEVNPDKCAAILAMRSPATVKEVQQLTGRMATLSRFVSASGEKGHPYFQCLKRNTPKLMIPHDVIPIAKKRMILDILRNQLELDNS